MTIRSRHVRLSSLLAVALGALALLALPALAAAKHGGDDGPSHPNGGENAGSVASYDSESGELTIDLRGGGTATALVTEGSRINCVGVRRGGHRHHQHRGRGRGHQGEDSATGQRHGGKKARPGKHRRRGHRCTADALTEGATIRKARIESTEDGDVFTRILVEKSKRSCDKQGEDGVGDEEGAGPDDDGTPDQGPGDA